MCIAFGKICADFSGSSPTGRCVLQGSHQSIVDAGLPARSAGAEMVEHGAIEPQRHKVFRAAALWAAYATDEIVALINFRLWELRVSQFGRVILCPHPWLRPPSPSRCPIWACSPVIGLLHGNNTPLVLAAGHLDCHHQPVAQINPTSDSGPRRVFRRLGDHSAGHPRGLHDGRARLV